MSKGRGDGTTELVSRSQHRSNLGPDEDQAQENEPHVFEGFSSPSSRKKSYLEMTESERILLYGRMEVHIATLEKRISELEFDNMRLLKRHIENRQLVNRAERYRAHRDELRRQLERLGIQEQTLDVGEETGEKKHGHGIHDTGSPPPPTNLQQTPHGSRKDANIELVSDTEVPKNGSLPEKLGYLFIEIEDWASTHATIPVFLRSSGDAMKKLRKYCQENFREKGVEDMLESSEIVHFAIAAIIGEEIKGPLLHWIGGEFDEHQGQNLHQMNTQIASTFSEGKEHDHRKFEEIHKILLQRINLCRSIKSMDTFITWRDEKIIEKTRDLYNLVKVMVPVDHEEKAYADLQKVWLKAVQISFEMVCLPYDWEAHPAMKGASPEPEKMLYRFIGFNRKTKPIMDDPDSLVVKLSIFPAIVGRRYSGGVQGSKPYTMKTVLLEQGPSDIEQPKENPTDD